MTADEAAAPPVVHPSLSVWPLSKRLCSAEISYGRTGAGAGGAARVADTAHGVELALEAFAQHLTRCRLGELHLAAGVDELVPIAAVGDAPGTVRSNGRPSESRNSHSPSRALLRSLVHLLRLAGGLLSAFSSTTRWDSWALECVV